VAEDDGLALALALVDSLDLDTQPPVPRYPRDLLHRLGRDV